MQSLETQLSNAISNGDLNFIQDLINKGINININNEYFVPLYLGCATQNTDIQIFLQNYLTYQQLLQSTEINNEFSLKSIKKHKI